ncbi:LpqB family beta-propeller domain-containing protein [Streptomyces johnsoniae]|uniref:LpqB family beta-propeller domain-containing protein n=1 Tax=Streptomyces johnsoniae TaxID=3075532 RepID=A0ABU2SAJ6_9ACTN|nr:LpqB family beta-propeller domain-containing protein [Streptomyces sp. DSM 41886]MDT0445459.1 LpqB family beta-propeller domain-containing protein [Streptomyces sp. DSM 41886]
MGTDRIGIGRARGRARWRTSRRAPGWARRRRAAVGLLAAVLLLTGCASMPGSGPVQEVQVTPRQEGESQVLVYGVPPEEGMLPQQIVQGFLEAVTSDDVNFDTARQYLTPERAGEWDPFARTTVLAEGPLPSSPGRDPARVELTGDRLATVDETHVYSPEEGTYRATFGLRRVDGEWRIDALPDGLVMGEPDFRRIYRSVDTFHYANLGSERQRVAEGGDVLVPDPVYVRRRIDPVGDTVRALLDGPGAWYGPVVESGFPEGTSLADEPPSIDDSGALSVRLDGVPATWPRERCERMAVQLLHTVQEVASLELTEARVLSAGGSRLCAVSRSEVPEPGSLDGDVARAYFLDEENRLVSVVEDGTAVRPVSGALGSVEAELRSAAVSRDGDTAAGVSLDGARLHVASLARGGAESELVLESASTGEDAGLSAPSWDGLGDLWVADRGPSGSQLLRLDGGSGEARTVPVTGLGPDERIESLRVASDGVRIALLISDGDGLATLQIGRIERAGGEGAGESEGPVVVNALRTVAPELEDVTAASWAGDSRLVVVGRPSDGVPQLQYVLTDGSSSNAPAIPGPYDVTGVAAAEDESLPLLAETGEDVAQLREDAQWKLITNTGTGSAPVYPG